jgi:hypothetical protein
MSKTMRKFSQLLTVVVLLAMLSACGIQESTSTGPTSSQNTSVSSNNTPIPSDNATIPSDKINLSWAAPSTRSDGSYLPVSQLAGYRVYMGTSDNNLSPLVDLNDETITHYTVDNLPAGSYYFSVSAYDRDGLESGLSQIVRIQLS